MAVAITKTADPAGVTAVASVATYSSQSIGSAVAGDIVCLTMTGEKAANDAQPLSATIDIGGGATAMTAATAIAQQNNVVARIFIYVMPSSASSATFAVTFDGTPDNTQNHASVYLVTGASSTLAANGTDISADFDATDPLTTGSQTIPASGGFLGVVAGELDTATVTWANATEDLDEDAGAFRHSTAISTTDGTVTITCTAGANNDEGALAWVIFNPVSIAFDAASTFAGAGSLSIATLANLAASALFAGTGSLSAATTANRAAQATMLGTGNLSVAAAISLIAAATFAGAGSLSASGSLALQAATAFAGAGSLSGSATVYKFGAVTFTGAGSLSALAQQTLAALATFSGFGSLTASGALALRAAATFAGGGNLSIAVTANLVALATLAGTGNLAATANLHLPAFATFSGAGSLQATAGLALRDSAIFAGAGSLVASMIQVFVNNRANFAGVGTLSVLFFGTIGAFANFGGYGHFCINGIVRLGPPGSKTNLSVAGPGVASNATGAADGVQQNGVVTGPGPTNNAITWGRG